MMSELACAVSILQDIVASCSSSENEQVLRKLKRKVGAELKFISSLDPSSEDSLRSVRCSNVSHLRGIHSTFVQYRESCCAVLKPFLYLRDDDKCSVVVDLVLLSSPEELSKPGDSCSWIKVISRNPRSIQTTFKGDSSFGERSIRHHAEEYLACARENPHHYAPPHLIFAFTSGVTSDVKAFLEDKGIIVVGRVLSDAEDYVECGVCDVVYVPVSPLPASVPAVNLDVTALIVMCSELCHGQFDYDFGDPHLNRMAAEEAVVPALSAVEAFIAGKRLFICESAKRQFVDIVSKVAGPNERLRANALLNRVVVVPDEPSVAVTRLRRSSRIHDWNCVVFGTGDCLSAVTLSSNSGFVRAASNQGLRVAVHLHPPRAFTEQKMPPKL